MKYHFLLLASALCAVIGSTQAQTTAPQPETQNQPSVTLRAPRLDTPPVYMGFSLQPVQGKQDIFHLEARRVDAKQLLTTLVQEAKGTAFFIESTQVKTGSGLGILYASPAPPLTLFKPLEGTLEQIIAKVAANSDFQFSQVNNVWTFLRRPIVLAVPRRSSPNPRESRPEPFPGFNANRNPGKIPDDAKPFDFNGDRYYHMPVR